MNTNCENEIYNLLTGLTLYKKLQLSNNIKARHRAAIIEIDGLKANARELNSANDFIRAQNERLEQEVETLKEVKVWFLLKSLQISLKLYIIIYISYEITLYFMILSQKAKYIFKKLSYFVIFP